MRKERSYLRKVESTGSLAGVRDALNDHAIGQAADIVDRLRFLRDQAVLVLQNAIALDEGDPGAFLKAVIRVDKLYTKMKDLHRRMPSIEACEQDMERILAILEEVAPGSRDKIIQRMRKKRRSRSKHTQ